MLIRVVARRLLRAIPTVWLIATICFFLFRLAPGDLADVMAGEAGAAPPGYVEELRKEFGLDRPLPEQYVLYLDHLATLDLGYSFHHNMPVARLIGVRLPATLLLGASSLLVAVGLGIALGSVAALNFNRMLDRAISLASLAAYAMPSFWVSLMLIVAFGVKLKLFPTSGMSSLATGETALETAGSVALHLVLPTVSLSLFYLALYIRLSRVAVLEAMGNDYVRMRQRVMIAMAIACKPVLLIADEPTTALDVTVQSQILRLLGELQREMRLSILMITHNLTLVSEFCRRVAVMYAGDIVEEGAVAAVLGNPRHPYTRGLLACLPPDPEIGVRRRVRLSEIPGQVPRLGQLGRGCRFADRCALREDRCLGDVPASRLSADGTLWRCIH